MKRLVALRTSVGKKAVAAVSGAILIGFLIAHAAGNLKVFLGPVADGTPDIDVYAAFLRTMGEPLFPATAILWIVRAILIGALVAHLWAVVSLARQNKAARPIGYVKRKRVKSSWAALWMFWSGLLLFLFIVVHLTNFTFGEFNPFQFVDGGVYSNLYQAFHLWYLVIFYVVAMGVLCIHVYHGAWSFFQTLGIDNPDRNRALRAIAVLVALALFVTFSAIPISFLLGPMDPPPGEGSQVQVFLDSGGK